MQIGSLQRPWRRLAIVGAVLCGGLLLGGCTEPDPKPIPTGPPSGVAPVFASDEEALAAAEAGYQAYQEMWSTIAMDGGTDAARIDIYLAPEFVEETHLELNKFLDRSAHASGALSFSDMRLQSYKDKSPTNAAVVVYACIDFSQARILDAVGTDITPAGRDDVLPAQITMVSDSLQPTSLVYGGDEKWSGDDFCQ